MTDDPHQLSIQDWNMVPALYPRRRVTVDPSEQLRG